MAEDEAGFTGTNRAGVAEDIDNQNYAQMRAEQAGDAGSAAAGGVQQAGAAAFRVLGGAREMGSRLAGAARGFAMEVSEALFRGGRRVNKDKR